MLKFKNVDVSVCRRFDLSTFWFVDVLVCRRFGLSTFRLVDVSVCRRFGLSTFWLSTFRCVDVLTSNRQPNSFVLTKSFYKMHRTSTRFARWMINFSINLPKHNYSTEITIYQPSWVCILPTHLAAWGWERGYHRSSLTESCILPKWSMIRLTAATRCWHNE